MIKGFGEDIKQKPTVEIKIGAVVPVQCKHTDWWFLSPDSQKCVDPEFGECPYLRKEKNKFFGEMQLCPMGGMTLGQIEAKNAALKNANKVAEAKRFQTRPDGFDFFVVPDAIRAALKLPYRPREIKGIVLWSGKAVQKIEGSIVHIEEPLEAIYEYPVFRFDLQWWKKNDLICQGDGANATWYPNNRAHEKHLQPRVCEYRNCPDFGTGKCSETGQLFFQHLDAPLYATMRLMTRSYFSTLNIKTELERVYGQLGYVSGVPITLAVEMIEAHPEVPDGQGGKKKVTKMVPRIFLRPEQTMRQLDAARKGTYDVVSGQVLALPAPPAVAPPPPTPVEQQAMNQDSSEDDFIDTTAQNVSKPAAAAEKKKDAKPTQQAAPPPASPAPSKQAAPPPANKTTDLSEGQRLEMECIQRMKNAQTMTELRQIATYYSAQFEQLGYNAVELNATYKQIADAIKLKGAQQPAAATPAQPATQSAPPPPASPAPPKQAAPPKQQAPAGNQGAPLNKKEALKRLLELPVQTRPFDFKMIQDFFKSAPPASVDQMTDEQVERILTIYERSKQRK